MTLLLAAACVPLVVVYVVACFRDPLRYALPPYLVSIPFSSLISIAPGPFGSVSSLLGLLLGSALLAQLMTARRGSPRITLAVPVWLAFLVLCGLSLFWSIVPQETVQSVAILASLVVLFVALTLSHFDRTALRRYETAVMLGGILVACYGLAQLLFFGGLPAPGGRAARLGNDLLDANNQAAALLLPLAIAAARSLSGSRVSRAVHAVATLFLLVGIVMTGSRGGLLAALVVLGTIVILADARRSTRIVMAAAAAGSLAVILIVQPGGIGERQLKETSSSGRSDIWAVGLYSCQTYCLTGAGWGAFPTVYAEELASVPEAKVLPGGTAYQPHNILLLAAVEAGVLGLLLVMLGLGIALVSALRLPRDMRGPPAAAMFGTLVSSVFLSNLEFKFFWAVLAYIAISETVAAAEGANRSPSAEPVGGHILGPGQPVDRG